MLVLRVKARHGITNLYLFDREGHFKGLIIRRPRTFVQYRYKAIHGDGSVTDHGPESRLRDIIGQIERG